MNRTYTATRVPTLSTVWHITRAINALRIHWPYHNYLSCSKHTSLTAFYKFSVVLLIVKVSAPERRQQLDVSRYDKLPCTQPTLDRNPRDVCVAKSINVYQNSLCTSVHKLKQMMTVKNSLYVINGGPNTQFSRNKMFFFCMNIEQYVMSRWRHTCREQYLTISANALPSGLTSYLMSYLAHSSRTSGATL